MKRRAFFRLAGTAGVAAVSAGALGAAAGSLAGCSNGETSDPLFGFLGTSTDKLSEGEHQVAGQPGIDFQSTYDVLVVGSGAAGLSAAMAPAEAGYSVAIAEKDSLLGGESYCANGVLHVAGSRFQQDAGVSLSTADGWKRRESQLQDSDVPDLEAAKRLYEAAPAWVDHLVDSYGAQFADPSTYVQGDANQDILLPKNGLGDMDSILVPIRDGLAGKGVSFMTGYRAMGLIVDGQGAICGVRFRVVKTQATVDVQAKRVVFATGGFAASQEYVSQYASSWLGLGSYTASSMGDAFGICLAVGGELANMDNEVLLLSDLPQAAHWGLFGPTLIVDACGNRYAPEDSNYRAALSCFKESRGYWWTIFDAQLSDGGQSRSIAQVTSKNAVRFVGPFSSVEDLAAGIGCSRDTLQATFDRYNSMVDAGKDDDFGRSLHLKKLDGPYYALKQFPIRYRTRGGLRTAEDGSLTATGGTPVAHLYACGSCAASSGDGLASNGAFGYAVGQALVDSLGEEA